MVRRLMHVAVVVALAAGLWLDLGLVSNGSLYALLLHDPWQAILEQRDLAQTRGRLRASSLLTLEFFGDSTCECVKNGDPADEAVPALGVLVQRRLSGAAGLLPRAWRVVPVCASGNNAYAFETVISGLILAPNPPKAAIIVVNMRSLNTLGFNGFPGNGGVAPALLHLPEFSGRRRSRPSSFGGIRDAVRFSRAAALLRSLTEWSREGLVDLITPGPLPDPDAPSRPEQMVQTNFKRVYGDGYALNEKTLEALISSGDLLAARGCRTLYYITPVDRAGVAREVGPGVVRQLDAGAAQAASDLRQAGYPVLDLYALLDKGFIDPPSEHLAAAGRQKVARLLSAWAYQELFPKSGAH
jgi:hypothetical protein